MSKSFYSVLEGRWRFEFTMIMYQNEPMIFVEAYYNYQPSRDRWKVIGTARTPWNYFKRAADAEALGLAGPPIEDFAGPKEEDDA